MKIFLISFNEMSYEDKLFFVGSMLLFFIISVLIYIFGIRKQMWTRGTVPKFTKHERQNLIKVYISLAVLMMKSDKRDVAEKRSFLESYFKEKFNLGNLHFNYTLLWSISNEKMRIRSVANWFNRHVPDDGYKSQLVYFLAEIAMIDGSLNQHEREILFQLAKYLRISKEEVNSIITGFYEAKFRKREEEKERSSKKHSKNSKTTSRSTSIMKEKMAIILEVPVDSDSDTIKKAYRTLVKIHHPDRFHNNGPEQILLAQERFIEIRIAYEYFLALNSNL